MTEKQKYIGGVNFDELRAQRIQVYNTVTLDLSTAQTDKELVFTGTYIYVLEATDILANVNIRLNEKFRGLINMTKGRGVKAPFYRLYITNAAQAGKTITLAIGIESDTFEVFDVGKALEISGYVETSLYLENQAGAFLVYGNQPKVAAEYTYIELWNPAASGITAYVNKITLIDPDAGAAIQRVRFSKHNARIGIDPHLGTAMLKNLGSAAATVCIFDGDNDAAELGNDLGSIWTDVGGFANFEPRPVFAIPEGYGLLTWLDTVNHDLNLTLEWTEK